MGCLEGREADLLQLFTCSGIFLLGYWHSSALKVFLSEPGISLLVICIDHIFAADL